MCAIINKIQAFPPLVNEKKSFLMTEIELLLAEKQTSLATLRTGIAVFTLPFSVLTILIATSSYYDATSSKVIWMFLVLIALCACLSAFGGYLIFHGMTMLRSCDDKISQIKKHSKFIDDLMVE